jgi:SAM-dependent methyltransferase
MLLLVARRCNDRDPRVGGDSGILQIQRRDGQVPDGQVNENNNAPCQGERGQPEECVIEQCSYTFIDSLRSHFLPIKVNGIQDKRLEAATFDHLVQSQGGSFEPFTEAAVKALVGEFQDAAHPRNGQTAIEVGCGTGEFTRRWAALGLDVLGIDLSPAAIGIARSAGGGPRYEVGDAEKLPLGDASVDFVIFASVLHHIPDFRPAVKEAHRVLVKGGICFAFDPNVFAPQMYLLRHPSSPLYTSEGVSPQERPLRPGELRSAFEEAGFKVSQSQHCRAALPYRHVGPAWMRPLLPLYNIYDDLLEKTRLSRLIGSFIITVGTR